MKLARHPAPSGFVLAALILFTFMFSSMGAEINAAQVSLAWEANIEPDLSGYRLYYGNASRSYSNSIDVGNKTSSTIGNLQDGLTYYFAATAYDTSGNESGYSNEVVFSVPPACTYSILPPSQSFDSSGGSGQISLTTQATCPWSVVSNASWVLLTSNSSGSGSATINYTVSANTGSASHTGTMTIAGQTFTVTQAGVACTYSLSSSSQSFSSSGGTGTVSVTAASGCSWTASSNASWITITSGSSGNGNGTTSYSVFANSATSSRTGTMTIAGQTFTVTQAGSAQNNPKPTTTSISPNAAVAGSAAFTLMVNGSGFVSASVVRWNGANRTTTFVSATQLTAAIPAGDIAAAGTAQVTVFNPAPGGGTSTLQTFTISSSSSTKVTFDNPVPPGSSGSLLNGLFQGINFGTGQWSWEGPYGVDNTNNIYFNSASGTSRTFTFSPSPRLLISMRVFTGIAGMLTLMDNLGQTKTQTITTGSMQTVTTGWTQVSTTITVKFTAGWELGVDDITYRSP